MRTNIKCMTMTAALMAGVALPAGAATFTYQSTLTPIEGNNTTANASASLVYDDVAQTLAVDLSASGLDDGPHPQHIHGIVDPNGDSVPPTAADDADGDGFVELAEGVPAYGPVIVPLVDADGMFPTSSGGGYEFSMLYDLTDPTVFNVKDMDTGERFTIADLAPDTLDLRELVIHGQNVPEGSGAGTLGEVGGGDTGPVPANPDGLADGVGGFIAFLPTSSGVIETVDDGGVAPIPVPAAAWLMLAGLGGLGALRARRG